MVRELVVVKVPRSSPLTDRPINFPPLENLHLELVEIKKKLKKGLPPVQLVKKKPAPLPPPKVENPSGIEAAAATSAASGGGTDGSEIELETTIGVKDDAPKTAKDRATAPEKQPTKPSKSAKPPKPPEPPEVGDDEDGDDEDEGGGDDEDEGDDEDDGGDDDDDDELAAELGDKPKNAPAPDPTTTAAVVAATATAAAAAQEEAEPDDPYAGLSPEEREVKEREEYIWRFRILKKQYKNKAIPDFNEHDDLIFMKTTYDRTVKELHLDSSVDTYRTYLVGGFMAIEFVGINFLGVDLSGFAAQQMTMMERYDRMLIELGEKSYNRWGLNIPIEIRLIGFIVLQAGLFYVGKIIADRKGGSAISDLYKMITGQAASKPATPETKTEEAPKKKMRGPSIKPDEIRKMAETVSDAEDERKPPR